MSGHGEDTGAAAQGSEALVLGALLVLSMAALCALFFGICLPFFLLSMKVLPSLGLAGVIYVFVGGLSWLLFDRARPPRRAPMRRRVCA